ncbi:MAG: tetraacyldisaccharide 4'-kinase [Deltaproteobacteria bacterium]|nr:tetraacyldisaccharide 4'-kinase [Deltaproteobacteria bacterium]
MLFLVNRIMRVMTDGGVLKKYVPPRPVVSVGNIHFGGTGKTPHVIYLAKFFIERGKKVCVLTRGYKRKERGLHLFPSGEIPDSVDKSGDESFLLKKKVPDVILCVGENRRESMQRVLRQGDVDLFLLDDGFQQFRMEKSFDAVLLRYNDLPGMGKMLNHVKMRESPGSMRHADFILVTKTPVTFQEGSVDALFGRYGIELERAFTRFRVAGIANNKGSVTEYPREGEFYLFGGVGDFNGLVDTAMEHGINVGGCHPLPDHVSYADTLMDSIRHRSGGRQLLTTEKDIVKLPYERFGEIFSLVIEVEFLRGKELFEEKVLRSVETG